MTREGMEYVSALLRAEEGTADHEIGWAVWMTRGKEAILDYLTDTMTRSAPGSRAFEVAYNVWLLLGGAGVAAQ